MTRGLQIYFYNIVCDFDVNNLNICVRSWSRACTFYADYCYYVTFIVYVSNVIMAIGIFY